MLLRFVPSPGVYLKAYVVVIVILIVIFGAIGGFLFKRFSAFSSMDFSPPPVTIAASIATSESWGQVLNAVGSIQAVRGVDLTSETSGQITEIHFDSGNAVQAGQLLVGLNDEIEEASRNKRLYTATLSTGNKHLHARSHHRFVITHFLQLSRGGQQ